MNDTPKPLSAALSQGWSVSNYSATWDPNTGALLHCFLLMRQGRSKILTVRKKVLGEGSVTEEVEV